MKNKTTLFLVLTGMIIITIAVIVLIAIDQIAKFFIIGKDINIIPNIHINE